MAGNLAKLLHHHGPCSEHIVSRKAKVSNVSFTSFVAKEQTSRVCHTAVVLAQHFSFHQGPRCETRSTSRRVGPGSLVDVKTPTLASTTTPPIGEATRDGGRETASARALFLRSLPPASPLLLLSRSPPTPAKNARVKEAKRARAPGQRGSLAATRGRSRAPTPDSDARSALAGRCRRRSPRPARSRCVPFPHPLFCAPWLFRFKMQCGGGKKIPFLLLPLWSRFPPSISLPACRSRGGGKNRLFRCDLPGTSQLRWNWDHGWPVGRLHLVLAFYAAL
jgi:hypothetical protein